MTPTVAQDQPTAAEAQTIALAHAAGNTQYSLADLRRNRSRAVTFAMKQAALELRKGDVERANAFLELAAAVEQDSLDSSTSPTTR